jgi:hypothetical protein
VLDSDVPLHFFPKYREIKFTVFEWVKVFILLFVSLADMVHHFKLKSVEVGECC